MTCLHQAELLSFAKQPSVVFQALWNRDAAERVRTTLKSLDRNETIVHIHGWTKAMSTLPIRVVEELGFSSVLTLHDFFAACPNGAFYDYQSRRCCSLTAMSAACITTNCDKRSYGHKMFRVARQWVQLNPAGFPRSITNYISLSSIGERLVAPYLPASSKFYRVENMTDIPRRERVNVAANHCVAFVGRLEPEKGIELLLQAATATNTDVLFIGDGPLRARVESFGRFRVTGWRSAEEVYDLLRSCRALIFPSMWYETYGLVVSEAMSMGIPAAVSDITAASERIAHGVNGWIFATGDIESLRDVLLALRDPNLVDSYGEAAFGCFWANPPTKSRYYHQLLEVYGDILIRRQGKQPIVGVH